MFIEFNSGAFNSEHEVVFSNFCNFIAYSQVCRTAVSFLGNNDPYLAFAKLMQPRQESYKKIN